MIPSQSRLAWQCLCPLLLFSWLLAPGPIRAEHFKGRCEGSVLLGSPDWPSYKQKLQELRQLLAEGQLAAGIELQREIADLQCHNHFQRYYLAELLIQAGRIEESVAVLAELYALGVNDLEKRLATESGPFAGLRESLVFQESDLAREIESKRKTGEARRVAFRSRLATLGPTDRPSDSYVAEGACPFECCSYRKWSVLEDTPLVAMPGSRERVALARKDTHVQGLTGEVHVVPVPVGVVYPEPAYSPTASIPKGAIVFLLDHLGEGIGRVWYKGQVHEMSTSGEVQEHCPHPGDGCWGEALNAGALMREADWWVKVRLEDGSEGWTRDIHFGDIDACG